MKTKLLILLIVVIAATASAQIIRQNDTIYFGPGLRLVNEDLYFHKDYADNNGVYSDFVSLWSLKNFRLFVRYRYGYSRSQLSEDCRDIDGEIFEFDSVRVSSIRNSNLGEIPCKLINLKCKKYNDEKGRYAFFSHKFYALQVDTTIHDIIDVCSDEVFRNRRLRRKALRRFSSLKVIGIEDFPGNSFIISSKADSLYEDELVSNNVFTDITTLQCMSASDIQTLYPEYYLPVMDSLMELFEYEKVSVLLRSQYERQSRLLWGEYKQRLQTEFTRYGDVSIQREYEIRKRMSQGKIDLDNFMNYDNMNGCASVFDTLCRIRLRHSLFEDTIYYPKYYIDIHSSAFYGALPKMNYSMIFDESNVRLAVKKDVVNYIYRHYLDGKAENPEFRLLLENPHGLLYVFKNDASPDEFWNLVSVSEKSHGHWTAQVDRLNPEIDPLQLDEAIYFNGLTTFVTGDDFVVLDSTAEGLRYNWINSFPNYSGEYNCSVIVNDNKEILKMAFSNINFYNESAYAVEGVPELILERWKVNDERFPKDCNYILRNLDPSEVIYYSKDFSDLNHDGVYEMFSFAVSNGKTVYVQCYTVRNRQLIKLEEDEAMKLVSTSSLFGNLIKYSAFQ